MATGLAVVSVVVLSLIVTNILCSLKEWNTNKLAHNEKLDHAAWFLQAWYICERQGLCQVVSTCRLHKAGSDSLQG